MGQKVKLAELAERAKVSRQTIYNYMARGMPYEIIDSRVHFDLDHVFEYLSYDIVPERKEDSSHNC